ncbi:family 10 glycosylhydrolase [Aurantibacter crassamenti]|uniref:alpha-amylase family protein n=1 Tax=Aurantibacter crassamenti TaxID=1837375 RepID=UPI00193A8194|nr:alpha-amylase family protein [Aurantibacter crassamenti]MBM1106169.1 family 10 glycosylhydrolase [Aurantibacter crassamenti]
MKKISAIPLLLILLCFFTSAIQSQKNTEWPKDMPWWKANNLRLIQTNLPAYEAELNVDSLITDLQSFSANVLLINAGGIMAFYPTKLDFQYTNPYMQKNMLQDVITKCHAIDIKVIVRFDFSRAHESIFKEHPDWFYISPKGERIINDDMYVISINAPYLQEKSIKIVEEVIDTYPIDGLFINMPGYATKNNYEGTYHGIDQNEYDKKRFSDYSGGLTLPTEENTDDSVFQKYLEFKDFTGIDWRKRMHAMVKSKSDQIAICTYRDKYVDIIRHESHPEGLPYWPYSASDNVNNVVNSYPNHITSNASIQQISFQSRYNAVEPEEVAIRLYENIANGSGLDISTMGDFRDYEDERNYEIIREVYAHHKKYEPYYGNYLSVSEIAVISPGYWPGGEPMQEYRGIQLMLNEAHISYDIIEDTQIEHLKEKIKNYKVIILPEITKLSNEALKVITEAVAQGTNLIATNKSLTQNEDALLNLFGAKALNSNNDGSGNYLTPADKSLFKSFTKQSMLFWKFNLGLYDFSAADKTYLSILSKGRPGPPEKIGGHDFTGNNAMAVKNHPNSKTAILPINLGKIYYLHGYEQHKNILLDIIDYLHPNVSNLLETNAHPRVETILQQYILNTPENRNKKVADGMLLHLVNITGYSGNTYFEPLPVSNIDFKLKCDFKPTRIFSMASEKPISYDYTDGYLSFSVKELNQYDGIVIEK